MVSKIFIVLLVIVAVSTTQRKADFTLCPNQSDAKKLVGNVTVDYPKKFLTVQVQYVRLPKTGMYDKLIKCIEVIDVSGDQSSGSVSVIEGGLDLRFVSLKLQSKIGGRIQYTVQAYTQ